MSEGIAEATAAEGIAAPRRHPLWDRLMPPGHRFVALWLAAGAATVSLLSAFTRQIIITALTLSDSVVSLTSHRGLGLLITRPGFLFPLAVFAVATATWLLFRHTSAPGVLALYFIASECVYCVLQLSSALANIPIARYIARAMSGTVGTDRGWWVGVVPSLAFPGVIIVGVATGTWLAWAMRGSRTGTRLSLADMVLGPDEDDAAGPETAPMVAVETPRSSDDGLASAFGWRGWRVAGADGIALGYPLTALIVGLVSHALSWITTMYAYSHLASNGSAFPIQSRGVSAALIGLGFVVYTAVYAVAIRRFGLSPAVWLISLAAGIGVFASSVMFIPSQLHAMGSGASLTNVIFIQLFGVIGIFAPLVGALIATRPGYAWADSATLPAEEHAHQ